VAAIAFATIYYDLPLAAEAAAAKAELAKVEPALMKVSRETYPRALTRAERLYAGKQFTDARGAFESLKPFAAEGDRDLIDLRIAQCEFGLKRYTATSAALHAYTARTPERAAEAEYLYVSTLRETGRTAEYFVRLKAFVDRNADPALAERALNDLGTFHILANEDGKAAEAFADLYRRFPTGAFAERAAWKAGWWAYRSREFAEAIRIFESAATGLRRADLRPAWLYWAARSRMQLGQPQAALDAYARVVVDYRNTYYGRAAMRESQRIQSAGRPAGAGLVSPARLDVPLAPAVTPRPPNAPLIQSLLAAGMYDEAIGELRRLQAGNLATPLVEATIAFAHNREGRLRLGINAMRRAYPQFMAAGGEALPAEILTVIFPVDHWETIKQHAAGKQLDQFLLAALIAQESTFQADIKSSANAWGLMQILPATGRQYARSLGIRPFSTRRLTEPATNVRIGTTFFSELLERFGDTAPALAAYNAGGSRVAKWLTERPGLDRDEFIDDIPYPETQNYVKRILGTADDYRRLYK
jgi:soluble lytic murein transglycosylase